MLLERKPLLPRVLAHLRAWTRTWHEHSRQQCSGITLRLAGRRWSAQPTAARKLQPHLSASASAWLQSYLRVKLLKWAAALGRLGRLWWHWQQQQTPSRLGVCWARLFRTQGLPASMLLRKLVVVLGRSLPQARRQCLWACNLA